MKYIVGMDFNPSAIGTKYVVEMNFNPSIEIKKI